MNIRAAMQRGWKLVEGMLERDGHTRQVPETVANNLGMPDWNPRTDAVAVKRFGAVFVSPGRYLLRESGLYMDKNGCLLDPDECPLCGSNLDKGIDYRFMVRIDNPRGKRLDYQWGYCGLCVSEDEIREIRRQAAIAPPPKYPQRKV